MNANGPQQATENPSIVLAGGLIAMPGRVFFSNPFMSGGV